MKSSELLKMRERLDVEERTWSAGVASGLTVSRKGTGWELLRSFHDRRLLDLFKEVVGFGTVSGPYGSGTYRWRVNLTIWRIEDMLECWHGWLEPGVKDKLEQVKAELERNKEQRSGGGIVHELEAEERAMQLRSHSAEVDRLAAQAEPEKSVYDLDFVDEVLNQNDEQIVRTKSIHEEAAKIVAAAREAKRQQRVG